MTLGCDSRESEIMSSADVQPLAKRGNLSKPMPRIGICAVLEPALACPNLGFLPGWHAWRWTACTLFFLTCEVRGRSASHSITTMLCIAPARVVQFPTRAPRLHCMFTHALTVKLCFTVKRGIHNHAAAEIVCCTVSRCLWGMHQQQQLQSCLGCCCGSLWLAT